MKERQKEILDKLEDPHKQLVSASITRQAYEKASNAQNEAIANEMFEAWKEYYKKNNLVFIDKNVPEHEFYQIVEFEVYMELFEEINFLLHRKDYLSGEVYSE